MANATRVTKRQEPYKALGAPIFLTRWATNPYNLGVSSYVISVSSKTILPPKYVPTPSADTTSDDLSFEIRSIKFFNYFNN